VELVGRRQFIRSDRRICARQPEAHLPLVRLALVLAFGASLVAACSGSDGARTPAGSDVAGLDTIGVTADEGADELDDGATGDTMQSEPEPVPSPGPRPEPEPGPDPIGHSLVPSTARTFADAQRRHRSQEG